MKFDLSNINLSNFDIQRGLKLPSGMSELLAEDIGIMVRDGHIGLYESRKKEYAIYVSGNDLVDEHYIKQHVRQMKKKLYNLDFPVSVVGKNKSEIRLKICSKGLVHFYHQIIELPVNKKNHVGIPRSIWSRKEYIASCLRGVMDTDFSFGFKKKEKYPVFKLMTSSRELVHDCNQGFRKLGIKAHSYYDLYNFHTVTGKISKSHHLYISGRENLRKIITEIGFSNKRMIEKTRAH